MEILLFTGTSNSTTCISESLTPKGLRIQLKPSMDDEELACKWKQVLHNASQELLKLLVEHHSRRLQEVEKERNIIDQKINLICDQPDKEEFVNDINESLAPKVEELKLRKERKLERDRRQQKQCIDQPRKYRTSKPKYSDMIRKHIQEKIKNPTPSEQKANTNESFSEPGRQRNTWKKDKSLSWKSNLNQNTTNRPGYNSYRSTQHDKDQSNQEYDERPQLHHRQRNSTTY